MVRRIELIRIHRKSYPVPNFYAEFMTNLVEIDFCNRTMNRAPYLISVMASLLSLLVDVDVEIDVDVGGGFTKLYKSRQGYESERLARLRLPSLPTTSAAQPQSNLNLSPSLFTVVRVISIKHQTRSCQRQHHAWIRLFQPHPQCGFACQRRPFAKGDEYGNYNRGMHI